MLLASAAVTLAAATLPLIAPLDPPSAPVVNIPGTTIDVCVIVSVSELDVLLRAQVVAALAAADTTLAELQTLCDTDTTVVVPVPPPATTMPSPVDDKDEPTTVAPRPTTVAPRPTTVVAPRPPAPVVTELPDTTPRTVAVVPVGAPETGDGSTGPSPAGPLGLAALAAAAAAGLLRRAAVPGVRAGGHHRR